ncbi:MAG: methionine--tRNA ligase [Gammaproteobacteria bacterium]|nr:methionine--tRNA ligase [Gammaproteobacteria bacterium]
MSGTKRSIIVTTALPYANGATHLGHLVGYLQTDIWARFQRLRGHDCRYFCGDDAHGTPIMLRAAQDGITPEQLIAEVGAERRRDFADFHIHFDNYYTTHSEENRQISELIYQRLLAKGHIARRTITQMYDPEREMFLPDRYIRGTCPHCGATDQYGDQCEVCSTTYQPTDLIDPVSAVSGVRPVQRESEHLFFKLGDFTAVLRDWIGRARLNEAVARKLDEWFEAGLQDWDISRDAPYFGFAIPGETGKYFYVWLDAPIGYFASLRNWCERNGRDWHEFVKAGAPGEMVHFIGKDIMYFHTLFWPAMLAGADFRLPTTVNVHGFLTVNGVKLSKSRGTFITARSYLEHLHPEYLRYYYAAKLGSGVDDLDLNLDDFRHRVNADLIGKVVNIASRAAGFIHKHFAGRLSDRIGDPELLQAFQQAADELAQAYENREYSRAMREVMALADRANQYIDRHKPWALAKEFGATPELHDICSMALHLFRILVIYLHPVLPEMARKVGEFLRDPELRWDDVRTTISGRDINPFQPLLTRIEQSAIDAMLAANAPKGA